MTRIYYKEAAGCLLLFDVMNMTTFKNCLFWKQDLDSKLMSADGRPIPCVLLASKCDLSPWEMTHESIDQFSKGNGFVCWVDTSAKENKNINEAVSILVSKMMNRPSPDGVHQGGHIQLDSVPKGHQQSFCC
ncbi:ras-related protein Rab-7L1-like [Polypterus senegalus]|uniref:ras-related protein Rab-7L1-like n=1 Tax=Polypterus senegalus TaxID=55291 RepID=UPI00196675DD|nr:ras-related protein Rab-7L1-like [Polypterus senegalus]